MFPSLTVLDLSGISALFTQRDLAMSFCDNVQKVPSLSELQIADTGLGLVSQHTIAMLADALISLDIKKLDVSHNFVMVEGMTSLADILEDVNFRELRMDYNSDRPPGGQTGDEPEYEPPSRKFEGCSSRAAYRFAYAGLGGGCT